MKMHVLTAAVLAALASGAALAASEGGDTWSAVEPVQQSTYTVLQSAQPVASAPAAPDAAYEGSEGGDTWSSLHALRETGVQQAGLQHGPGRIGATYAGADGGSEGGDTWSRFVPQSQPTGSTALASAPNGSTGNWMPPLGE